MSLQQNIQKVIDASGAEFGLALRHLESGEEFFVNPDSYYQLASVFKIPILVEAFHQVREGRVSLDERIPLKTEDKNLPSGVLVFFEDGLNPTVLDYLTLMIIISDNTGTDVSIKRLGGTRVIENRMKSLGLDHIHIQMTVRQLFDEILPNSDPTQDLYELAKMERPDFAERLKNNRVYKMTPENNVATPRDMNCLLQLIWDGKTPDRKGSDGILEVLLKQQLNDRIPRYLPNGTRVAHKTGTIGGVRNDAGIIYANDHSHVALTLFTRHDPGKAAGDPRAERQIAYDLDSAMGEVALLAFEAYKDR